MTNTDKKRAKMIKELAAQNYGSEKTIGPRQTAVVADILTINLSGVSCTYARLKERHPVANLESVLFTLRARGLIKTRCARGKPYEVTAKGFEIGMMVRNSNIPAGLGVVAVNVRKKRKKKD
jgi:predicted transcriptional regulator